MTANTYWSHNGRYQQLSDQIAELVPPRGELEEDNPVELYRVAANVYADIFNNGLGNAHLKVPPFLEKVSEAISAGVFEDCGVDREQLQSDFFAVQRAYEDYLQDMEDYQNASPWEDDEDFMGDEPVMDAGVCEAPMESIIDALVLYCAHKLNLKPEDTPASPGR